MGLGKTLIAVAAAEELLESNDISTVLIVCPASLKYQWAEKIGEYTNYPTYYKAVGKEYIEVPYSEYCTIIDGNKEARREHYNFAHDSHSRYVIIGYDNVLNDYDYVRRIKPDMVVLDEATAIKSFKAQRSKRIKKLLRAPYRMALTGTPVENKPDELFSIMQWVDEDVLGRYDLFEKAYINRNQYGWVVSYKNLPVLRKKLEPAIARLTDKHISVRNLMPDSHEENWYVNASPRISEIYQLIATDMLTEMDKHNFFEVNMSDIYRGVDESKPSGKLMAMYVCLEMLVCHPDLIVYSGMQFKIGKKLGSRYAYELWQSGALDDATVSPKLEMLIDKTETCSNKVLIYSKYKFMLSLIADHLSDSVIFHGGMSPVKKAEAVSKFKNTDVKYFLSSYAGAYGMDMNMSDLLIDYDLPWSAGKQDQINYRHIRRSSAFDMVYIRNLIMKNSFEERRRLPILDMKRRLGSSILDGSGEDASGRIDLSGFSLRDHLTEAARYGILDSN